MGAPHRDSTCFSSSELSHQPSAVLCAWLSWQRCPTVLAHPVLCYTPVPPCVYTAIPQCTPVCTAAACLQGVSELRRALGLGCDRSAGYLWHGRKAFSLVAFWLYVSFDIGSRGCFISLKDTQPGGGEEFFLWKTKYDLSFLIPCSWQYCKRQQASKETPLYAWLINVSIATIVIA